MTSVFENFLESIVPIKYTVKCKSYVKSHKIIILKYWYN